MEKFGRVPPFLRRFSRASARDKEYFLKNFLFDSEKCFEFQVVFDKSSLPTFHNNLQKG